MTMTLIALQLADVPYLTDAIDACGGPLYATAAVNAVLIVPLHDFIVDWDASPKFKARASALLAIASALIVTLVSGVDLTAPIVIGELFAALGGKELGHRIQSKVVDSKPSLLALPRVGGLGRTPESYGLEDDPAAVALLTRDGAMFSEQRPAATGSIDITQGD